jgi:mannan endo-1,4-beta-mannosidase
MSPASADKYLNLAVTNHMTPILEIHDATGDFSKLQAAFNYWSQSAMVSVIQKYEADMIVNIANEAGNGSVADATYVSTYTAGISQLRNAGIKVPLLIDGSEWGQNVEQLLRVGQSLVNADPLHNVILSWHEYSEASTETTRITKSFEAAKAANLPLIVGEFAGLSADNCSGHVPYAWVMSEAQRVGIGWIAWSWSHNGDCNTNGVSGFDMVSDGVHLSTLKSGWATDAVNNIGATSHRTYWQQNRACK